MLRCQLQMSTNVFTCLDDCFGFIIWLFNEYFSILSIVTKWLSKKLQKSKFWFCSLILIVTQQMQLGIVSYTLEKESTWSPKQDSQLLFVLFFIFCEMKIIKSMAIFNSNQYLLYMVGERYKVGIVVCTNLPLYICTAISIHVHTSRLTSCHHIIPAPQSNPAPSLFFPNKIFFFCARNQIFWLYTMSSSCSNCRSLCWHK